MLHLLECNFSSGPDQWDDLHLVPEECHVKQSPINIIPQDAVYDETMKNVPLELVYDSSQAKQLINNGHSLQVTYHCDGSCKRTEKNLTRTLKCPHKRDINGGEIDHFERYAF